MLRLLFWGTVGWSLYRAGQATALGVPVVDALLSPLKPVGQLRPDATVMVMPLPDPRRVL